MRIEKRDWLFIGAAALIVIVFFAISGKEKTKVVPKNDIHRPVYEAAYKNGPGPEASIFKKAFFKPAKKDAEKLCEPCHQQNNIKLPPNHPPKYRCLFCHKLAK